MLNSQLILNQTIIHDEWTFVALPSGNEEIKKQAGKVVLFKLTGESLLQSYKLMKQSFHKLEKLFCH